MERSSIAYRGNSFLSWGYSTVIFSLSVYTCLRLTTNELYYCLYAGIPILANVVIRLRQKDRDKSDIEVLIDKIWFFFGMLTLFMCIVRYYYAIPLFALISFLMGVETIITGVIIKYYMISALGFIGVLGSALLLQLTGYEQNVVISTVFLFIAVIPGYIINYSHKNNK